MLRELFTPNIQRIKSIRTDGTDAPIRLCRKKPGMNKSESSEFWAYIRPKPLASAPQPTLPAKRGQRFLYGPSRHSPYSFQRTRDEARPNAGRGTTERGTRRNRTWDETQSNAGRDAIERGRAFADKYRD